MSSRSASCLRYPALADKLCGEELGGERFAREVVVEVLVKLNTVSVAESSTLSQCHVQNGGESFIDRGVVRCGAGQTSRCRRSLRHGYKRKKVVQDDTESIVKTMIADKAVWLAMLSREQLETRETAAKWLATLNGKPIDFDPTADEKTRKKQIERLETVLGLDS